MAKTGETPAAKQHFTRRRLPLAEAAGLEVVEAKRLKAAGVDRGWP